MKLNNMIINRDLQTHVVANEWNPEKRETAEEEDDHRDPSAVTHGGYSFCGSRMIAKWTCESDRG